MSIFSIISLVFGGLLALGFIIGVLRGWKKSLARVIILVSSLVLSIVFTPIITSSLVNNIVSGSKISAAGFEFDISELISDVLGEDMAGDLQGASDVTNKLVVSIANVLINMVVMIALFIVINLIALIVYWIVAGIKSRKIKRENIPTTSKTWWGRLIGGGVSAICSLVVVFAFLIPIFGLVTSCDKLLKEDNASASAYNSNSLVAEKLFYTEDEKIGQIEEYLETYAEIKGNYDNSFFGKFMSTFGIDKLGNASYVYLSTVNVNGDKIKVSEELDAVLETYNCYKANLLNKSIDFKDNESIDTIKTIYNTASNSKFLKEYVASLLPMIAEKVENGEEIFGMELPIPENLTDIVSSTFSIFNSKDVDILNENINAVFDFVKVLNNYNILSQEGDVDFVSLLKTEGNENMVKDMFTALTKTTNMKKAVTKTFNSLFEMISENIAGTKITIETTGTMPADVVYSDEGEILQDIVKTLVDLSNNMQEGSNLISCVDSLGEVIDDARSSKLFSNTFKQFFSGVFNSDKIKIQEPFKSQLLLYIDGGEDGEGQTVASKWDNVETFSFKNVFSSLAQTADLAQTIMGEGGEISLDGLKNIITNIGEGEKEVISGLIESAVSSFFEGDDSGKDEVVVMQDMLDAFLSIDDEEEIEKAFEAGQQIVELILNPEEELQPEDAKDLIDNLASSNAIMTMIENDNNGDSHPLGDLLQDALGDTDFTEIIVPSEGGLTESQCNALKALLGLD